MKTTNKQRKKMIQNIKNKQKIHVLPFTKKTEQKKSNEPIIKHVFCPDSLKHIMKISTYDYEKQKGICVDITLQDFVNALKYHINEDDNG